MIKRKNYILQYIRYIQCIVERVVLKAAFIHKMDVVDSHIKDLKIRESDCKAARITKSDFSESKWKNSDLTNVQIDDCKIEGLRINGYLIVFN